MATRQQILTLLVDSVNRICTYEVTLQSWDAMCQTMTQLVFAAAQDGDRNLPLTKEFRRGLGFLMCDPKAIHTDELLDESEWRRRRYFDKYERSTLERHFKSFVLRILEWCATFDADEDARFETARALPTERKLYLFSRRYLDGELSPFKQVGENFSFRAFTFEALAQCLEEELGPIRPGEEELDIAKIRGKKQQALDLPEIMQLLLSAIKRLSGGVEELVAGKREDEIDAGERDRPGSPAEWAQEDAVLARLRTGRNKKRSSAVRLVLADTNLQRPGCHPNNEDGYKLCYSRVTELLNPTRRKK